MIERLRQIPKPLFFLYAGTIVTRMGSFVFPYLTIYLSESREIQLDQVGMILSVGSIGLLAGNFAGGWLADRWSRKGTLIAALLFNAIGFGCLAFPLSNGYLYALFLLIGYFGSGMYNPAANTLIADYTDESQRSFAYTINYVCVNFGMALGPLLGGFLATIGYHWIFIGDVLSSLVCAALVAIGVMERRPARESAPEPEAVTKRTRPFVWFRHRMVLAFCLIYFFLICPLMGLEYAVPLLIKKEFQAGLVNVGLIYTINAACILGFSFLVERWIRGRNEFVMMLIAGLFWTMGLGILFFGYSLPALMICTIVWTIGEIVASILVPTFIAKRVHADVKGRFLALNDIVRSLAGVICPIGLGFVWVNRGPVTAIGILFVLPLIGLLGYTVLFAASRINHTRATAAPVKLEVPS